MVNFLDLPGIKQVRGLLSKNNQEEQLIFNRYGNAKANAQANLYVHEAAKTLRGLREGERQGVVIPPELRDRVKTFARKLLSASGDGPQRLEANYLGAQIEGQLGGYTPTVSEQLYRTLAEVGPNVSGSAKYVLKFTELDKKYLSPKPSATQNTRQSNSRSGVEERVALASIIIGGVSFVLGMVMSSPSLVGNVINEEGAGFFTLNNLFLFGGVALLITGLLAKATKK